VGLYCRVSHDPSGRGTSVADQEKEGRTWCAANGHDIAWVVVDNDLSASRHARTVRPGFTEVQSKLAGADPVDILWAWESSRFQRDLEVYVQVRALCERYGVLWSYHGRTYDMARTDDRFSTGMDALLAERYADETRDRVLRASRSRMESGKAHGRIPYGYRSLYAPHTGAPIGREPDPDTAPVVKEIVRRVLSGESNNSIASDLNRRGVPSPHAVRLARYGRDTAGARGWTLELVARVARSPSVAGIRSYKGAEVGDAAWEPIISVADHNAVLAKFADPNRLWSPDRSVRHLLGGIAVCGVCGEKLKPSPKAKPQYWCRTNRCVARAKAPVDLLVVETLLTRLERDDAGELFLDEENREETSAAIRELAELEARLEAFRVSAEDPQGISPATLARMEAKYLPLIEDARRRSVPAHVPAVVRDLAGAGDVRVRWGQLSLVQQRAVIRHLMTVTILPTTRGGRRFEPSHVRIEWRSAGGG
jgi:DNA invertase Pin-like site-specific DNA recombinase